MIILLAFWSALAPEVDPVGNWKMVIEVGHLGEGLRTVILEITENDGVYYGRLTSMQNKMTEADEVLFDGETLAVHYGSYEYRLNVEDERATGTVTSPAGTQDVTATRQQSQLFAGDDPEPYQKTWRGRIERQESGFVVITRRGSFHFKNGGDFEAELMGFVGQDVAVTGLWRVDRIEIQTIEPRD